MLLPAYTWSQDMSAFLLFLKGTAESPYVSDDQSKLRHDFDHEINFVTGEIVSPFGNGV